MTTSRYKFLITLAGTVLCSTLSCTNLDDKVLDRPSANDLSGISKQIDPNSALQGVYSQLNVLSNQANTYALQEHPTDEMMGPTRGTDWSDFGTWRRLHQHSWDGLHNQVIDTWNELNTGVYRATQTIALAGTNNQLKAEATFLRAFFMFQIVDLYGQVPFREVTDDPDASPKVYTRSDAFDFIIKDLESVVNVLDPNRSAGRANPNAARFLLAKAYLNKAVYKQDPTKPAGPYTFAADDMTKVVEYCDAIINGGYQLSDYFDNFHWENSTRSKELIFVIENTPGSPVATVQNRYYMTLHYFHPLNGGGWNGFTTLADFYASFEASDKRRSANIPDMTDKLGLNAGFITGQQRVMVDGKPTDLKDRGKRPLVIDPKVNLLYSNERSGIRVIKYFPQPIPNPKAGSSTEDEIVPDFINAPFPGTDYVLFRFADVLLMKAEAILRGGTGNTAPLELVNEVRASRGASVLGSLDEAALLAERGRELYWEGWRRNDQIRFGRFLQPVDQRPNQSPEHVVVYPIPQRAVDTNPNLKQNFGY